MTLARCLAVWLGLLGIWGCTATPRIPPATTDSPGPVVSAPPSPALAAFLRELHRPRPFVSHPATDTDPGWLGLAVNFEAVSRLRTGIERRVGHPLDHRGEAHITVITPPEAGAIREYDPALGVDVLEGVARPGIEAATWSTPGIGRVSGGGNQAWFLVVDSPDLRAVREHIARSFALPVAVFDPGAQDLHVTIGWLGSDLWPPAGGKGRASLQPELGWQAVLDLQGH